MEAHVRVIQGFTDTVGSSPGLCRHLWLADLSLVAKIRFVLLMRINLGKIINQKKKAVGGSYISSHCPCSCSGVCVCALWGTGGLSRVYPAPPSAPPCSPPPFLRQTQAARLACPVFCSGIVSVYRQTTQNLRQLFFYPPWKWSNNHVTSSIWVPVSADRRHRDHKIDYTWISLSCVGPGLERTDWFKCTLPKNFNHVPSIKTHPVNKDRDVFTTRPLHSDIYNLMQHSYFLCRI